EIKGSSGLDPVEVERMRKEAESHAGEAKQKVELINARNQAESAVYQIEKTLKENEGKISETDAAAIRASVDRVKQVKEGDDAAAIKRAVDELMQASYAMAQHMYGQAQQAPGGDGQTGDAPAGKYVEVLEVVIEV